MYILMCCFQVVLSAGYTLWLEPLEYRNYLTSLDTYVVELSLSKELVKCGFGVSNPGHLKKLYELCHAGGLAVPTYEKGKYFKLCHLEGQAVPTYNKGKYLTSAQYILPS
jgi:hypothetical protein